MVRLDFVVSLYTKYEILPIAGFMYEISRTRNVMLTADVTHYTSNIPPTGIMFKYPYYYASSRSTSKCFCARLHPPSSQNVRSSQLKSLIRDHQPAPSTPLRDGIHLYNIQQASWTNGQHPLITPTQSKRLHPSFLYDLAHFSRNDIPDFCSSSILIK